MHASPVHAATLPSADTTPTCRRNGESSAARAPASASAADAPASSASRHLGPYAGEANAWVATAPTPARAHGTITPTPKAHVSTATPSTPLAESRATIEYVIVTSAEPTERRDETPQGSA